MSLACSETQPLPELEFSSWSPSWPPTASSPSSWPSGHFEASENGPKWFPIPQNIGFDTRTMSLACSKVGLVPKLEFHSLKSFLTSYSPSTQFLAFTLTWSFWKWSQVITQTTKRWFWHQNHVSSMLRNWVTPQVKISLLEGLLGLIQPLHPVLGLLVDLMLL